MIRFPPIFTYQLVAQDWQIGLAAFRVSIFNAKYSYLLDGSYRTDALLHAEYVCLCERSCVKSIRHLHRVHIYNVRSVLSTFVEANQSAVEMIQSV